MNYEKLKSSQIDLAYIPKALKATSQPINIHGILFELTTGFWFDYSGKNTGRTTSQRILYRYQYYFYPSKSPPGEKKRKNK